MRLLADMPVFNSRTFRLRTVLPAVLALTFSSAIPSRAETGMPPMQIGSAPRGSLQGALMPLHNLQLSSRAAGVIESFGADEGQRVEAGALLVQLNADVERADVARAEAALEGAQAQLAFAKNELQRVRTLHNDELRIGSKKELDEAQFQFDLAVARRKQAEADLQMARARLHERAIFAPIAGTVLRRSRAVGEAVERLETVVQLVDASKLELTIYAGAELLGKFTEGQPARIKIDSGPARGETIDATVFQVDPTMHPESGTFRVRLQLEPTDKIQPGIFVTLQPPSEVN